MESSTEEDRCGSSVFEASPTRAVDSFAYAIDDIEVDAEIVDSALYDGQGNSKVKIIMVPREYVQESALDRRVIDDLVDSGLFNSDHSVANELMEFLLDNACMSCEPMQPVQSILRAPRQWKTGEDEKHCDDMGDERSVEFRTVVIHEFGMTIGDHPNAVSGPPVRLDWDSRVKEKQMSLEEYEQIREPRRSRRDLKLSLSDRHRILVTERGLNFADIKGAWKEALDVRAQRIETLSQTPFQSKWEEFYESLCRKYDRVFTCSMLFCF